MLRKFWVISTIINRTLNKEKFKVPINDCHVGKLLNFNGFCTSKIPESSSGDKINSTVQPLTPLEKLFEQIDTLKDIEVTNQNLERVVRSIESSPISPSDKTSVIKYLTTLLFRKNFPEGELLNNPLIKRIHKYQPFLQIESVMYVINKEKMKSNVDVNKINDLYLKCFNEIIPLSEGSERLRCEVLMYKNFGRYLIENGMKEKGIDLVEKSVTKHKDLILEEYNRMENLANVFIKEGKTKQKTKEEKERHQLQLNAMKENIRRLMESMFEVLYYFYQCKRDLMQGHVDIDRRRKEEYIVSICFLIKESMSMKSLVPKVQLYSRYYHRLMQIFYELEYAYALMKKDEGKVKEVRKSMKEFEKECMYELEEAVNQPEVLKQIIIVIFSIELHLSRLENGRNTEQVKKDLSECGFRMIEIGRMQDGSIAKEMATKLLADFLKKNLV